MRWHTFAVETKNNSKANLLAHTLSKIQIRQLHTAAENTQKNMVFHHILSSLPYTQAVSLLRFRRTSYHHC